MHEINNQNKMRERIMWHKLKGFDVHSRCPYDLICPLSKEFAKGYRQSISKIQRILSIC